MTEAIEATEPTGHTQAAQLQPIALARWHRVVVERSATGLSDLIADDAVFHSPIVHRPQVGKDLVIMYLTGALHVLANESFTYVREVVTDNNAVLEFLATVDGVEVNGVDMITWDAADQITDFKVMLRPIKAINLVQQRMAALLASG